MTLHTIKTRFIFYLVALLIAGISLFNLLLGKQSSITYKYFIEKPAQYNLERAERLSAAIYKSFEVEVPIPSNEKILGFLNKYNDIPFLSVDFIYEDDNGEFKSVSGKIDAIEAINAEYVFPVRYENGFEGSLLVYGINKEYKRGIEEYEQTVLVTRVFFVLLLFLLLSIIIYHEYSTKISEEKYMAEYDAAHDGLTGLYNNKYFREYLSREFARSTKHGYPIAIIMCDIDYFKSFNDSYGHIAGDKFLKLFAGIILHSVKRYEAVARYGGEEFVLLLSDKKLKKPVISEEKRIKNFRKRAVNVARRISARIKSIHLTAGGTPTRTLTVSIGLTCREGLSTYTEEDFINEADMALYESKKKGRAIISAYDPITKELTFYT